MRSFSGPAPNDILYLKFKKHQEPWSISLCEVLDGNVSKDEITAEEVVISKDVKGKPTTEKWLRADFMVLLDEKFKSDKLKVEDFAILPEGEVSSGELTTFLEKHSK